MYWQIVFVVAWVTTGAYLSTDLTQPDDPGRTPQSLSAKSPVERMAMGAGY